MTVIIDKNRINADNFYQAYTGSTIITSNNTALSSYSLTPTQGTTTASTLSITQIWNAHLMMSFTSWGSTNAGIAANFFYSLTLDVNGTK